MAASSREGGLSVDCDRARSGEVGRTLARAPKPAALLVCFARLVNTACSCAAPLMRLAALLRTLAQCAATPQSFIQCILVCQQGSPDDCRAGTLECALAPKQPSLCNHTRCFRLNFVPKRCTSLPREPEKQCACRLQLLSARARARQRLDWVPIIAFQPLCAHSIGKLMSATMAAAIRPRPSRAAALTYASFDVEVIQQGWPLAHREAHGGDETLKCQASPGEERTPSDAYLRPNYCC
jgi:hypothetical protein